MYQNGVMPTAEWFYKILGHVSFKDKSVVDYGCAEGKMAEYAKAAGAKTVIGIDNQEHFQPSEGVQFYNEEIGIRRFDHYDIKIFSMIIHWLGKAKTLEQLRYSNEVIIIFREKNDGYKEPDNGVWFPTLEELDETLKDFSRKHSEVLMEQDNNKRIILVVYEKDL